VAPEGEDRDLAVWEAYGRMVGFDAAALRLPDTRPAAAGRRLALRHSSLSDAGADPGSLDPREVWVAAAERWAQNIADGGYDLHGDLAGLTPGADGGWTARTPEQRLVATEATLADALVENGRLRARAEALELRNGKLEKTRRRLKRRLADAITG
jgi:hypothetical protein